MSHYSAKDRPRLNQTSAHVGVLRYWAVLAAAVAVAQAAIKRNMYKQQTGIPVIVGRRQIVLRVPVAEVCQRVLTLVKTQPPVLSYLQQFPTFFTANLRGWFVHKTDEILRDNDVDGACITETWL